MLNDGAARSAESPPRWNRPGGRAIAAALATLLGALAPAIAGGGGGGGRGAPPCPVEASALVDLPVREVTVFKDGHAFLLHEGELPVGPDNEVLLTSLPTPVIGTFWPYVAAGGKLTGVTAGSRTILVDHPTTTIAMLLAGNIGRRAIVQEVEGPEYEAEILGFPGSLEPAAPDAAGASGAPPATAAAAPAPSPAASPQPSATPLPAGQVMLKTLRGVRVVNVERIRDLTFRDAPVTTRRVEEKRNVLTLRLAPEDKPRAKATVGMVYLQRGIRWIPNYRIDIDGEGKAHVQLQATLLNEMVDLESATVHLVIGVPSFALAETIDPIALQDTLTQLSRYFQAPGSQAQHRTAESFGNAIQTQTMRMSEYRVQREGGGGSAEDDEVSAGSRHEDLFVFSISGVTLRKGERMVVPVVEFDLSYEDVFALNLPFSPPADVCQQFNSHQQAELARLMSAPRVMHTLRITNGSPYPLTTAPAIVLQNGRLLAQTLMTYTTAGAQTDLDLMPAVDVTVVRTDNELQRMPNAAKWRSIDLAKIELEGKRKLVNRRAKPARVEVVRYVLGQADSASADGSVSKVNVLEDGRSATQLPTTPWWGWYSWPEWWGRFNGVGRIEWKKTLEPGAALELSYRWSYYW